MFTIFPIKSQLSDRKCFMMSWLRNSLTKLYWFWYVWIEETLTYTMVVVVNNTTLRVSISKNTECDNHPLRTLCSVSVRFNVHGLGFLYLNKEQ